MITPFVTGTQAILGDKSVTLRKLGWETKHPRVEILLNGYGLGHVPVAYASQMFPEVRDWLAES